MTTLDVVKRNKPEPSAEELAAKELVRMAAEQGLSLTGPDGLVKQFTKTVLETALNEEITEHLGHQKNHAEPDRGSSNVRNGTRPKTVLTEATGHVEIDVPRDRGGSFEPIIVKKHQRRLTGVDEMIPSLYAHGLTTGEISAHFAQIYGAQVSKETISRIMDKVSEEMQAWANRPLDGVYAAIFIDAIVVKIRDGQVANRPIYAAIGVSLEGEKDVLEELTEKWGRQYGAIIQLWEDAWEEFTPFLAYDVEIRTVICSTNAIESLNARYRRAVRARGHFPTEAAALKCLYLVTRSLDPTGAGRTRWTVRCKPALNAFAITFADRWPAAETY